MQKIIILIAFAFTITIFIANAQKLPNIQLVSLRAPENVKIDGKPNEWGDKFQAYNNATNFYYTMANDDQNLYLVVQVTDPLIIAKIISAGITIAVDKSGKRNDKSSPAITYPIFDIKDRPNINVKNKPVIVPGSETSVKKADSLMQANNKRLADKSKYIRVAGIKGLDTLISVYNEDGIKAAELFDNQMVYTCELSVALKHLGVSAGDPVKFSYHIKSNGSAVDAMNGITITKDGAGKPFVTISPTAFADKNGDLQLMGSTTDFWGEYTLVKK
jgi:hypothetical protein